MNYKSFHWRNVLTTNYCLWRNPRLIALKLSIWWRSNSGKKNWFLSWAGIDFITSALAVLVFIYFHEDSLPSTIQTVESLTQKFRTIKKSGRTEEKQTFVHIQTCLSIFHSRHKSGLRHITLTCINWKFYNLNNLNFQLLIMVGKIMLLCSTPVHCLLCKKEKNNFKTLNISLPKKSTLK